MEYIIDQAIQGYQSQLDESTNEFIGDVDELQDEGLSTEEMLAILAAFSMVNYWFKDLQMQRAVDIYLDSTGYLLDDMYKFGKITETQLLALRKMQESAIINYSQRLGEEIRLGLSEGIAQGLKGSALRERIASKLALNPGRIEGVIGTALATYNRSVTNIMLESLPDGEKLYYHGPLDDKTRPICRVMLSAGALTKKEVEANYPGALIDGGGINCRHDWLPTSSDRKVTASAKEQIAENPGKFAKAKTLLEYTRGRAQ